MALQWLMRGLVASLAVLSSASASRVTNTTWPGVPNTQPNTTSATTYTTIDTTPTTPIISDSVAAAAAAGACVVDLGTHAGALLADMRIEELLKKNGGAWNSPEFRGSSAGRPPHKIERFKNDLVLKISHPKNHGASGEKTFRGRPVVKWGPGFSSVPRGLPGTAAVIEYDVFFKDGWSWSRGGKMHGLTVGHGPASAGRRSPTSASFRVMWQPEGGAVAYVYLPYKLRQDDAYYKFTGQGRKDDHTRGDGSKVVFGTGLFRGDFKNVFRVGQWNHVEIGIKMNSFDAKGVPRADGVASLVINGRMASFNRVKWRARRDIEIEAFEFGTFAGGPDPQWTDGWQFFKGFGLRQWQD
jgi:hypothetical protein